MQGASLATMRGANGISQGMVPFAIDAFDRFGFQAQRINFPRRAEHAGDDRNIESFDVFEHQRRAFVAAGFF